MNASRLLEHFDRISEAPDAIPKLRKFILDLAVRGKLVEQDPQDGMASDLLKDLRSGRAELIREGTIRIPRDHGHSVDDAEYSLPVNWQWCLLSDVGAIVGGGTPPSGDLDNFAEVGRGTPWLTPADLGKDKSRFIGHGGRDLSEKGLRASSATLLPTGSVLFTSRAPIGYTAIAANPVTTNQGFKSVVPFVTACNGFMAIYFQAFADRIEARASGTTFREVSGKVVAGLPFPLPPLAEQRRIVAKVDELMGLCDRLEAAQGERDSVRTAATHAALGAIASGSAPEAALYLAHMERLAAQPEQIGLLRSAVVDLALRARLVEQVSTDKNAHDLLRELALQVEQSRKQSGLATPAAVEVDSDEVPFAVPSGWAWARLSSLFNTITDGDHLPPPRADEGVAFLTIGNVSSGTIDFSGCRLVPAEYFESLALHRRPTKGDILYTVVGATYGRPVIVDVDRDFCVQRHIAILKPAAGTNLRFLFLLLKSSLVYDQASSGITGTAQPTIPIRTLRDFVVPVPPLSEQERIVARVGELMALCDELGSTLARSASAARGLLHTCLQGTLPPAS